MSYHPTTRNLSSVSAFSGFPVGTIIVHSHTNIPLGFLECNGQLVSRTTYIDLFNIIGITYGVGDGITTFQIPDLRGEFIRGLDNGRGIDTNRIIGSNQGDMFKSHAHNFRGATTGDGTYSYFRTSPNTTYPTYANSGGMQNTGGIETRPRNVAMVYCIKY